MRLDQNIICCRCLLVLFYIACNFGGEVMPLDVTTDLSRNHCLLFVSRHVVFLSCRISFFY